MQTEGLESRERFATQLRKSKKTAILKQKRTFLFKDVNAQSTNFVILDQIYTLLNQIFESNVPYEQKVM